MICFVLLFPGYDIIHEMHGKNSRYPGGKKRIFFFNYRWDDGFFCAFVMGESLCTCLLMLTIFVLFVLFRYPASRSRTLRLDSSLPQNDGALSWLRNGFFVSVILCKLRRIAVALWIEDDEGSALDRDLPLAILADRSERESIDWRVCRFYDQTVNLNSESICYFVTQYLDQFVLRSSFSFYSWFPFSKMHLEETH